MFWSSVSMAPKKKEGRGHAERTQFGTWMWRWLTEADEPALLNPRRNPGSPLNASAKSIATANASAVARWWCESGYLRVGEKQTKKSKTSRPK